MTEMERLAERLTPAQQTALLRLADSYVCADMRSVKALARRGLAAIGPRMGDIMLGDFNLIYATPRGRDVATALRALASQDGGSNG